MKKLLTLMLCIFCTGCGIQKKEITYTDIVVDKYTRQELDNLATWWWDIPLTKKVYYFKLKEYSEKEVTSKEYDKYKIGDTYTWTVVEYE